MGDALSVPFIVSYDRAPYPKTPNFFHSISYTCIACERVFLVVALSLFLEDG